MSIARLASNATGHDLMHTTTHGGPRHTLRRALKQPLLNVVARLPDGVQRAMFAPRMRRICIRVPLLRAVYSGCLRRHPFDLQYGIDTSGLVDAQALQRDPGLVAQLNPYMGSQPTIIRRAIDTLGDIAGYTFIDIGCGKGRPLVVASEYPFARILGCDISAELVKTANENAIAIAGRFAHRPPIRAIAANVADLALPPGNAVVFLFNPFGPELMAALLAKLEAALASGASGHLFVVYDNPVCGDVFDASPHLQRWFARMFAYDSGELGFGPEEREGVVIWQSVRGARPDAFADRHRRITTRDRMSASLD
ncbi:class I SAM-dependent methyltransferase [Paraburkholderia tropica]|uniref:Methyltransferase domain-containing protein n=1 Tax=Paraburkholderia tropica TaxID=92647 RepID=A0AAQ1JTU6_9BURK|nr:class I SAM-dependent methyltransferase [Paraburkholderia tropica]RQN37646.1 class I SAM-dependent methyltransferase [Paraburkholderia tropica]SEJ57265.1 Methyltransferase domain-containing protein [Paraburkholderia tropica]